MNNDQILVEIKRIKGKSAAYQRAYRVEESGAIDEIGGHVGYALAEEEETLCPSEQFLNTLFEECAAGLGFEYEH